MNQLSHLRPPPELMARNAEKAKQAIAQLGRRYVCHPVNRVSKTSEQRVLK